MTLGPPPSAAGPSNSHSTGHDKHPNLGSDGANPDPDPEYTESWNVTFKSFLTHLGLTQTLLGFEADMLIINAEWERKEVPKALETLIRGISHQKERIELAPPLEDRKLDHFHFANGVEPKSQTSITRDISRLLARNRARNDASNRIEFLNPQTPSCARTDAKPIDRDLQMKYDIAKNEEGPLRRTVGSKSGRNEDGEKQERTVKRPRIGEVEYTATTHPVIDERIKNVEAHLAVRYVPAQPRTLLTRLKFIEDHLVQLEREYPPWAALHFNQPRRGWPPPPRPTPIIVPSHLTSTSEEPPTAAPTPTPGKGKGKTKVPTSSLRRAVMEKLEVQKAMNDLRGNGASEG